MSERIHDLKVWPPYFDALLNGTKTFEIRSADRGFRVGDTLLLREWKPNDVDLPLPAEGRYTGREIRRTVCYLLTGGRFGLAPDHVCMGLAAPDPRHAKLLAAAKDVIDCGEPGSVSEDGEEYIAKRCFFCDRSPEVSLHPMRHEGDCPWAALHAAVEECER